MKALSLGTTPNKNINNSNIGICDETSAKYTKPKLIASIFHPVNLLICDVNVTVFSTVMVVFFWFALSKLVDMVIVDKTQIIIQLALRNPAFKKQVLEYISINYDRVRSQALENEAERYEHNVALLHHKLLPFIYAFVGLGLVLCLVIRLRKTRVTRVDILLLGLNVFSFTTELVIYFVLLIPWVFVGDMMLTRTLLTHEK